MSPPVVYTRFQVRKSDGTTLKLNIQDLDSSGIDKIIPTLAEGLFREESFMRSAGVYKTEKSIQELIALFVHRIKDDAVKGIVCYEDKENGDDVNIAGFNLLTTMGVNEPTPAADMIKEEEVIALMKIVEELKKYDLNKMFDIEQYVGGMGLFVYPDYRRLGISTKILEARKPMMEHHGVKLTSAWFTSAGSQKAAAVAGYELVAEETFDSLTKATGVQFRDVPPTTKLMILKSSHFK